MPEWQHHTHGASWIQEGRLRRASHALAREGRIWLVDPVASDGLEEQVAALGEPAGVLQLLDRHARDCAVIAARLGVPHHVVPFVAPTGFPFALLPLVRHRFWLEVALWWPEERLLACADALGTVGYFTAPGEELGVHPFLRLRPPRALAGLEPLHVLCGHGLPLHGERTPAALADALRTARRRLPAALLSRR